MDCQGTIITGPDAVAFDDTVSTIMRMLSEQEVDTNAVVDFKAGSASSSAQPSIQGTRRNSTSRSRSATTTLPPIQEQSSIDFSKRLQQKLCSLNEGGMQESQSEPVLPFRAPPLPMNSELDDVTQEGTPAYVETRDASRKISSSSDEGATSGEGESDGDTNDTDTGSNETVEAPSVFDYMVVQRQLNATKMEIANVKDSLVRLGVARASDSGVEGMGSRVDVHGAVHKSRQMDVERLKSKKEDLKKQIEKAKAQNMNASLHMMYKGKAKK
jgi:hypothetical protein